MKYPDFIEQLILEKEYTQLTPAEKQQVDEWIESEAEYNNIHSLLAGLERVIEKEKLPVPSAQTKNSLKEVYIQKHNRRKGILGTMNRAVVVSIAASVIIIAVAIAVFTSTEQPTQNTTQTTQEISMPQKDTQPIAKAETNAPTTEQPDKEISTPVNTTITENTTGVATPIASQNTAVAAATYPDLMDLTIAVF